MADIKGIVTKKIGPLPVWAYVVVGAGMVFVLGKFKGGGLSGGDPASTIRIPTLAAGSPSSVSGGDYGGDGAIGSPGQNQQGGMDTQPAGAPPWWSTPPAWWSAMVDKVQPSEAVTGNVAAQRSASVGRIDGRTAAQLAAEPAGGWKAPPVFQQISPTKVIDASTLQTGGALGGVNPASTLQGYSNPVTGEFRKDPFPGASAIWR